MHRDFDIFECIINLILLLQRKQKDSMSILANAGKINNPNKMHQLSPKRQTGCPEKDIIL